MGTTDGAAGREPSQADRSELAKQELADEVEQARSAVRDHYAKGNVYPGIGIGQSAFQLTGSSSAGGGYDLDPDALAAKIVQLEQLADRIENQTERWDRAIHHANPPSADPPAGRQASRARSSFEIGREANRQKLKNINELIRSMKGAHGGYVQQDDETSGSFQKAEHGSADTGGLYKHGDGANPPSADTGSLYEKRDHN